MVERLRGRVEIACRLKEESVYAAAERLDVTRRKCRANLVRSADKPGGPAEVGRDVVHEHLLELAVRNRHGAESAVDPRRGLEVARRHQQRIEGGGIVAYELVRAELGRHWNVRLIALQDCLQRVHHVERQLLDELVYDVVGARV